MTVTLKTRPSCTREGCTKPAESRGYCRADYQWARRQGIIVAEKGSGPTCAREGCEKVPKNGPECHLHRGRKPLPPKKGCSFVGCENLCFKSYSLCYSHALQKDRGDELSPVGLRGTNPKSEEPCYAPRCGKVPVADGLCQIDWERAQSLGGGIPMDLPVGLTPCPVNGCEKLKRARHLVCNVHRSRSRKFGLLPHIYLEMINAGCVICGSFSRMAIDHDHSCCPKAGESCGKCVRGALCGNCNNMLGHGKKPETLRRGAEYLERFTSG